MNGGDTDTGGAQVDPRVVPPSSSGPQPVESATPSVEDSTVLTNSYNQSPVSSPSQPSPVAPAPVPTSPTPASTTPFNPPTPTQPQVTSQPLQPAQPLSPSSLPPQQPAPQFPTQPVFSNNSDVIIGSPAPKKSKKVFIIAVIIIIILAGIIAFLIFNTLNTPNKSQVQNEIRTRLNLYSNYFLYQTDSDAPIGDIIWTTSQMEDYLQILDDTERKAYFVQLNQLYTDFETALQGNESMFASSDEESVSTFNVFIDAVPASLQVYELYLYTPNISKDYMINSYFTLGPTEMVSEVTQSYTSFNIPDNLMATQYRDLKIEMANVIVELYDIYDTLGCINEGQLDEICAANYADNANLSNVQATLKQVEENISDTEWSITENPPMLSRLVYQNIYQEDTNENAN